jgi:hypothetical protein
MVRNKSSQIANLTERNCLSYRNVRISLTESQNRIISGFANSVKGDENYKFVLPISENNVFMLRNFIAELLYTVVEKDSGTLFFITDGIGEVYLKRMLTDFHTDYTSLKINFLKYQKKKIHITHRIPDKWEKNDIFFFFRTVEAAEKFPANVKMICFITLRDIYRNCTDLTGYLKSFNEAGWSLVLNPAIRSVDDEKEIRTDPGFTISRDICSSHFLKQYSELIGALKFGKDFDTVILDTFVFFYQTIPVPLRWYDYYKSGDESEYGLTMLPSEQIMLINGIDQRLQSQILKICEKTEKTLMDENPKYQKILDITRNKDSSKSTVSAIIMPNRRLADSFDWALVEMNGPDDGSIKDSITLMNPDSLFTRSLDDGHQFDQVIFPFVPSPEMILVSRNLSDHLHFIIYPEETDLLDAVFEYANEQNSMIWDSPPLNPPFRNDPPVERSFRDHIHTHDTAILRRSYTKFLEYLTRGDPTDDEHVFTAEGYVDERHFILSDGEGNEYELRGWDQVVLYREQENNPLRKYQWIPPRVIKKSDTIFLIPNDVHREYLKREISGNTDTQGEGFQILIDYLSKWKKALIKTRNEYSMMKVQKMLQEHGLNKTYLTVVKWYDGLGESNDPKLAANNSVIDPNYNIGPKYAEDILKFGQTFGDQILVKEYKEIYSAMRVFRVNNQHIGRITMHKIIMDFNEGDIAEYCIPVTVKRIRIKE